MPKAEARVAGTGGSSPKPPDLWGIPRDRPASSPSETLFGCDARGAPPADERLPRGPNPRARLGLRHRPIQPRRTILIIGYLGRTRVRNHHEERQEPPSSSPLRIRRP